MVRDIHPAEVVTKKGAVLTGARVFLTNKRCAVWVADRESGRLSKPIEFEVVESDAVPSRNTLGEGERIEVVGLVEGLIINKGKGCGCGSKLKALNPPINWTR